MNFNFKEKYYIKMFRKFPSIGKISSAGKYQHISTGYIRQEKIHGANFQIIIGTNYIRFGSRNNELPPIGEPSDFFDFSEIAPELTEFALKLQSTLGPCNVYGELYGGGKKIQLEIIYNDKMKFRVFDVLIGDKWLPYERFDVIKDAGFDVVNTIETGSLEVLLNRPTEFVSEYSDCKTNSEGYVVKKITSSGDLIAFKNKAPSFVEAHQKKKITQPKFSFKNVPENDELRQYIMNKNRLDALNSKIGPPTLKNVPTLATMLINDAVEEYCVDNENVDKKKTKGQGFKYYNEVVEYIKNYI